MHLPCTMMPESPEFSVERCQDVRSGDFDLATMLDQAFATAGVRPQPRFLIFVVMMRVAKPMKSIPGSVSKRLPPTMHLVVSPP